MNRRWSRNTLALRFSRGVAFALAIAAGAALATPAMADEDGWHDHGRHRGWERHREVVVVPPPAYVYAPPPPVYAPPQPVYVAPPPVYAEPSINLVLPIHIR